MITSNNSSMYLGNITINNVEYAAVLYFKDPDGKDRPITKQMGTAQSIFHQCVTNLLNAGQIKQQVTHIDSRGFIVVKPELCVHNDVTQKLWHQFISQLNSPTLALQLSADSHHLPEQVEANNSPISDNSLSLIESIQKKISKDKFPLTEEEKKYLESLGRYPELSNNKPNALEKLHFLSFASDTQLNAQISYDSE